MEGSCSFQVFCPFEYTRNDLFVLCSRFLFAGYIVVVSGSAVVVSSLAISLTGLAVVASGLAV